MTVAAAGILASTALTTAALAGGSIKDAPVSAGRTLAFSFNIGGTSDYVFRGFSQSAEKPAVQGGVDLTYGIFYAGIWASMIDFGNNVAGGNLANSEVDFYAGIKPVWGPLNFDFGVIYYAYPGAKDNVTAGGATTNELDYIELKAGVSGSPFKNMTLGTTVFYSPDYTLESGTTWTIEGSAAYELPKLGPFTPTISALIGTTIFDDLASAQTFSGSLTDDSYLYWNAGLSLGVDKITLDFRYWDTDAGSVGTPCSNKVGGCDERFVFSAKVTLP